MSVVTYGGVVHEAKIRVIDDAIEEVRRAGERLSVAAVYRKVKQIHGSREVGLETVRKHMQDMGIVTKKSPASPVNETTYRLACSLFDYMNGELSLLVEPVLALGKMCGYDFDRAKVTTIMTAYDEGTEKPMNILENEAAYSQLFVVKPDDEYAPLFECIQQQNVYLSSRYALVLSRLAYERSKMTPLWKLCMCAVLDFLLGRSSRARGDSSDSNPAIYFYPFEDVVLGENGALRGMRQKHSHTWSILKHLCDTWKLPMGEAALKEVSDLSDLVSPMDGKTYQSVVDAVLTVTPIGETPDYTQFKSFFTTSLLEKTEFDLLSQTFARHLNPTTKEVRKNMFRMGAWLKRNNLDWDVAIQIAWCAKAISHHLTHEAEQRAVMMKIVAEFVSDEPSKTFLKDLKKTQMMLDLLDEFHFTDELSKQATHQLDEVKCEMLLEAPPESQWDTARDRCMAVMSNKRPDEPHERAIARVAIKTAIELATKKLELFKATEGLTYDFGYLATLEIGLQLLERERAHPNRR